MNQEKKYNQNDLGVANQLGTLSQAITDMDVRHGKDHDELKKLIKKQNSRIGKLEDKQKSFDVILGKAGMVITLLGVGTAVVWNALIDVIKGKFID